MAPHAILGLLATLILFSGCLDGDAPQRPALPAPAGEEGHAENADPPTGAPAPLPDCPEGGQNNYGTWTQVGDEYIVSPYGGNLVVYYRESNGCPGLQAEHEWAHNPDTKVAEIPSPVLDGVSRPAKA